MLRLNRIMNVFVLLLLIVGCSIKSAPTATKPIAANNSSAIAESHVAESGTFDCDDPKGYSVEEGTDPGTNSVKIVRDGTLLHTIKLPNGTERNGFAFDGARKTKEGFEIEVEYGSVIYYHKKFIFTCRHHRFHLSKIWVDSFNKHNPEKWTRKLVRVHPNLPLEKFSITDFMLEGVVRH